MAQRTFQWVKGDFFENVSNMVVSIEFLSWCTFCSPTINDTKIISTSLKKVNMSI